MKNYLFAGLLSCLFLVQCSKKDAAATVSTDLNNKSVGASANDFLSANKYTGINVQLQYMPGYAPNPAALDSLTNFLNLLVNKPGGININQTPIAASGKSVFTLEDLNTVDKANRSQFNSGNTLSVYIVYVDAPYSTPNVLGAAYKNTSLVIFGPTVNNNSGGVNQPPRAKLESTVQKHEFGHLLGLTNLGTPMVTNHEDGGHAAHCNNSNCLMYFSTQTTVMGGILLNGPVPVLDANCRADLRSFGGK